MIRNPLSRPHFVRRAIALAVAVATLSAAPLAAQEPTGKPTTHTVKKGDTLWDIAKMYLNDPFLWPEIYRLNTNVVEDPHWIYPGELLQLPGSGGPGVAAAPTPEVPGAQVVAEDQVERQAPVAEQPRGQLGTTVFAAANQRRVVNSSKFGGTANTYQHTAVRAGEYYAAPWLDNEDGPAGAGEIVRSAQLPGQVRGVQRDKFTNQEYLYITLPKGVVAAKGDKFMVFAKGEDLGDGTRVMLPTGLIQVVSVDGTDAVLVRILKLLGGMLLNQHVTTLERFAMNPDARPAPLLLGTEGKVIYIPPQISVGNKEDYVILDVSLKDGVKIGDLFTVYKPRTRVEMQNASTVTVPEESIGLLQVVKVTQYGATALVVDVRHPAIIPGANVRLTARMP